MSEKQKRIFFGVMIAITIFAIWQADFLQYYGSVVQAWVTIILVLLTAVYVYRTAQQASASMKLAKETTDARFAALRPIVRIHWIGSKRNAEITVSFKNMGLGPALNLVCYLTHSKYSFRFKHDKYIATEVGESHNITFPTEAFDFVEWDKLAINCDYKSVYGQPFRSSLKFNTEDERYLEIIELNKE